MPNSDKPRFEYDPPSKTHLLVKIAFGVIALIIIAAVVMLVKDRNDNAGKRDLLLAATDRLPRQIGKGEVLPTRFFDVKIDTLEVVDSVYDITRMIHLPAQNGNRYVVLSLSFKNNDMESKMIPDGRLCIDRGNNEIKYDDPEVLDGEGWGMVMENINPGITRKTKIVYKIPAHIKGNLYYYPDISFSEDRIFLATL